MDEFYKADAVQMLANLSIYGAANGGMDEEGYTKFLNTLKQQAGFIDINSSDTFDKEGLQALRRKLGK